MACWARDMFGWTSWARGIVLGTGWPFWALDLILTMTTALIGSTLGMDYGSRFWVALSRSRGLVVGITTP